MYKVKIQIPFSRKNEIIKMRGKLEKESFPRFQMFLLVAITSGGAFLTSYIFLNLGLTSIWMRYLFVCLFSYAGFLLLIGLWLRTRMEDYADVADISDLPVDSIHTGTGSLKLNEASMEEGGSSSSFSDSNNEADDIANPVTEAIGVAAEAEELALPLIVLILFVTLILSSAFIIYSAPVLFAELTVDSLLAAGLYKRLQGIEPNHWLKTTIRRTYLPFIITTIIACSVGGAIQNYEPNATSLNDILKIIFY